MQQHKKRRKVCYYCQNKLDAVDFKNTELLIGTFSLVE